MDIVLALLRDHWGIAALPFTGIVLLHVAYRALLRHREDRLREVEELLRLRMEMERARLPLDRCHRPSREAKEAMTTRGSQGEARPG